MKTTNLVLISGATTIVVILFGAVSFFAGMHFGRANNLVFNRHMDGAMGEKFMMKRIGGDQNVLGIVGEVVSADSKSVTVRTADGGTKKITISDSTVINKQTTGTPSDLKAGERVAVFGTGDSDETMTAQTIQLNPATGFGPMMMYKAQITPTPTAAK